MKKIAAIVRLILFSSLIFIMVLYCSAAFRPKKLDLPNDTTNKVNGFYALEDNSIDVLFLGTSHTYYGFNPSIIYAETGLSSYVFAGECQPMGITYHYLKEALKTQSPQLIVLDVFSLLPSSHGCQTNGIYKKNVEDFKFSENKLEALKLIKEENVWENLFDISIYKNRWEEISKMDLVYPLKKHFNDSFGYTEGYPVNEPLYERPMFFSNEMKEIDDPNINYLYKLFDLADNYEIDVLLVKTPYYETEEEHKIINYLFHVAEERGYQTLNLNQYYDQMNFMFDRDGDLWHCNVRGAWKISKVLSDFLKQSQLVSIHPNIYSDEYHDMHRRTLMSLLKTQYDVYQYLEYLNQMDITILVNYIGKEECYLTDYEWQLIENLGILRFDTTKSYISVVQNDVIVYASNDSSNGEYEAMVGEEILPYRIEDNYVRFDYRGTETNMNYVGINLVIIDNVSQTIVDQLCLDTMGYFQILK